MSGQQCAKCGHPRSDHRPQGLRCEDGAVLYCYQNARLDHSITCGCLGFVEATPPHTPDRPDHTRSAIEERVQEQRRATGTRRYTLTLEVSVDPVVGGYTATEASFEPGGMVGRGASPREAIADWIREAEHEGCDPEDDFREVPR